jgi:CCR4-NOT transcriptional regulation complex NOT5 subunit
LSLTAVTVLELIILITFVFSMQSISIGNYWLQKAGLDSNSISRYFSAFSCCHRITSSFQRSNGLPIYHVLTTDEALQSNTEAVDGASVAVSNNSVSNPLNAANRANTVNVANDSSESVSSETSQAPKSAASKAAAAAALARFKSSKSNGLVLNFISL